MTSAYAKPSGTDAAESEADENLLNRFSDSVFGGLGENMLST